MRLLAAAAVAVLAPLALAQDAAEPPKKEEPATSVPPVEVVATGFPEEPGRRPLPLRSRR